MKIGSKFVMVRQLKSNHDARREQFDSLSPFRNGEVRMPLGCAGGRRGCFVPSDCWLFRFPRARTAVEQTAARSACVHRCAWALARSL